MVLWRYDLVATNPNVPVFVCCTVLHLRRLGMGANACCVRLLRLDLWWFGCSLHVLILLFCHFVRVWSVACLHEPQNILLGVWRHDKAWLILAATGRVESIFSMGTSAGYG